MSISQKKLSRRSFLAATGAVSAAAFLAACAPAAEAPAETGGDEAAPGAEKVMITAHMVEKQDVSTWIEMGMEQDIDGWVSANPDIEVDLATVPGWTPEYVPKILSLAAAGTLGDLVWFPPRHRSHIAWGESYDIVTDLNPLAEAAGYDMAENFFAGANEVNSFGGKQYWMSYISEPIVPMIAYNKTKIEELGIGEPSDDWTFDELAEWAQAGTNDDHFGYFRADRDTYPFHSGPYLRQFGVEPVSEDGLTATFMDTPDEFLAAMQYQYDLLNTWQVSPSPQGGIEAPELYGAQKVLAVDVWPFRISIYPTTFTDFEHGFALTPVVNAGDDRRSMLNEHVFGITTSSEETDAAFSFLTWIAGHEMNVQAMVQAMKGPIARPDLWEDDRIYENDPAYEKLAPIMQNIEPDFNVANYRGQEFDDAYGQYCQAMEIDELSPEEAVVSIQEACQAVLDKEAA